MRNPIIAGNWKMNNTLKGGLEFIDAIKETANDTGVDVVLFVPAVMLHDLKKKAEGSRVHIGAQTMHYEESGAFTGEISPLMLKEIGVEYVIIGHSERRQYYNETDESVNKKVLKALELSMKPIMCCGETLEERESGKTNDIIKAQILKGLKDVKKIEDVVIAYEPIWAIGTGKTATSTEANDVIYYIRTLIKELYDEDASENVRIQYGGSVKPENVEEIMNMDDIDGALVGGASLKADSFIKLVDF